MKAKIKELVRTQRLCSIYTNSDSTEKFAVGYVLQSDDNYFLMESIDQYGKSDGIFCSLIDNIIEVETDSMYNECIQKLFEYFKQKRYKYTNAKSDILKEFIDYIVINKKLSTIELCNSGMHDAVGFIKIANKGILELETIDQYGRKDGNQIINIRDISHITCSSIDDIKMEILNKINK